ncbi:LysR family transcriptional regulator [Nonomuraea zeae]|uniref:LysR family transcriptional regulator n=1 Tax=Nonomuraea zeae TaxID=1642303 RepID=A0A5S4H3P6_9ACTN|nr:LysR family transcriptional regulator [Nonomuraea zeae]TMR39875.1 LysR family transcriptional regulator [Nonomuraea zeae]
MLETAALRYFREVARTGSIARAADHLFIAPSAISRQLRLLEEHLGVELFNRGPKGMTLTAAGEVLLGFADQQLATAERLHMEFGSDRHRTGGRVSVATVEAPLSSFVPEALAKVAHTHPDIEVNVVAAGSNDVAAFVAESRADLGLVFGPVPRSDVTELATRPLPLFVMVEPGHPLAARPNCDLRDLLDVRLALPDKSFGIRQEVERAAAGHHVRLIVAYETNSLALLRELAVRTGVAIFMPLEGARPELEAGLLTAVPINDRRLTSTRITLISGLAATGSPALTVVSDALVAALRGPSRGGRGEGPTR